jgi:hypothetical protein
MAGALALAIYPAAAQDPADVKKAMAEELAKTQIHAALEKMQVLSLEGGVMANISGAPYSAEQVSENTQTLGDGTRIHHESTVKVFRDGKGRVRRESPDAITIFDPVAGVGYRLNPKTMTASKMQVSVSVKHEPNSISYSVSSTSSDGAGVRTMKGMTTTSDIGAGGGVGFGEGGSIFYSTNGPNIAFARRNTNTSAKVEQLGSQSMEGVTAQGERRTNTIEAGEIGNDRPIQEVNERWYSPELQLEVMTRHSDPRSGEQTMRLMNIQRGEPDPSLFQLPAAYQVIEPKIKTPSLMAVPSKDQ